MAQVTRTRTVAVDPATVWALLADFGELATTTRPSLRILERIVARLVARRSASLLDSLAQATERVPT